MAKTFKISETSLPGLLLIERPPALPDGERQDLVQLATLNAHTGQDFTIKQINHSYSVKGVLRGLHAEHWDKITWVVRGKAFSAIVDLRPGSPTFGRYEVFELSGENGRSLYIPEGFANSIFALEDTHYMYCFNKLYDGTDTTAVAWNDPDIAVPWPSSEPILSKRDQNNPTLRELFPDAFSS